MSLSKAKPCSQESKFKIGLPPWQSIVITLLYVTCLCLTFGGNRTLRAKGYNEDIDTFLITVLFNIAFPLYYT